MSHALGGIFHGSEGHFSYCSCPPHPSSPGAVPPFFHQQVFHGPKSTALQLARLTGGHDDFISPRKRSPRLRGPEARSAFPASGPAPREARRLRRPGKPRRGGALLTSGAFVPRRRLPFPKAQSALVCFGTSRTSPNVTSKYRLSSHRSRPGTLPAPLQPRERVVPVRCFYLTSGSQARFFFVFLVFF